MDDPNLEVRGYICLPEGVVTSIEQFLKSNGMLTIFVDLIDVLEL
jgi:hypothetical protein